MTLVPPNPERRIGWRARYVDPDSGETVWETIPDPVRRTDEARQAWAAAKARTIATRRLELDGGAPRATGTTVADAVKRFYDDHPHLGETTRVAYRAASDKLVTWCGKHRVECDTLTGAQLVAFRAHVAKEPRGIAKKGGKRGEFAPTKEPRSPASVNRDLRSVGTVLNYLRRLGLLPRLSSDALGDGLQKLKAPPKRIDYRKPHELQRLIDAALRHDANTFAMTRAEHDGEGEPGSTLRHTPIAPVVVAALMTGMRVGHLLDLEWSDVDLEALDEHGNPVGEIVPKAGSQTKRTGVIGLEVSPALRKILAAMKLASGGRGKVLRMTRGEADAALKRLTTEYGAPPGCTWQAFRRTCGCYLTNAPGIFGAASAYRSAKQLGHSVQIAERSYVGLIRGIPRDARTLEAAMQIEPHVARVVTAVSTPRTAERPRKVST